MSGQPGQPGQVAYSVAAGQQKAYGQSYQTMVATPMQYASQGTTAMQQYYEAQAHAAAVQAYAAQTGQQYQYVQQGTQQYTAQPTGVVQICSSRSTCRSNLAVY